MKPVTNILLVLALVCYVFLPFFEISFQGTQSGLAHTAGLITQNFSVGKTIYALLPFITCFAAISVNGFKNRYWGIAVMAIIAVELGFLLNSTGDVHQQLALTHDPDLMAEPSIAQGFEVTGLGIGYQASLALTFMAMISAFLSILPFKFNLVLEEQIDHGFEEGKKHLSEIGSKVSSDIHSEIGKLEEKSHLKRHKSAPKAGEEAKTANTAKQPETPQNRPESDYMPPEMREAETKTTPEAAEAAPQQSTSAQPQVIMGVKVDDEDNSSYMPHSATAQPSNENGSNTANGSDDDRYKAYMPKGDGDRS